MQYTASKQLAGHHEFGAMADFAAAKIAQVETYDSGMGIFTLRNEEGYIVATGTDGSINMA